MEPERWPQTVRDLLDTIGTACGDRSVAIDVKQLVIAGSKEHFGWLVIASCPELFSNARWQIFGCDPLPAPEPIAEPTWYSKLEDLPPGGTQ